MLLEEETLRYTEGNLAIKLIFSKFIRFQEDKQQYPNLFCWFGFHSVQQNPNIDFAIVDKLYKKHFALFQDDFDGEIKPTIFEGKNENDIKNSFNSFYNHNIYYDLLMKWVEEEGEFKFNYKWLVNTREKEFIPKVKQSFERFMGISLQDIKIV